MHNQHSNLPRIIMWALFIAIALILINFAVDALWSIKDVASEYGNSAAM